MQSMMKVDATMLNKKDLLQSVATDGSSPGTPQLRYPMPDSRFIALLEAVKSRDVVGVRTQLRKGLAVNHREPALGSKTPLICAAEHGFEEAVDDLLNAGANPSMADGTGATPLHMAAGGGHQATVSLLLRQGTHVDPLDAHASTPLHYAAKSDGLEPTRSKVVGVVDALLRAGARCGLRDNEGRLPLHNAATAGNVKLVQVLASGAYKATVNLKDNDGRAPLHCAVIGARSLETVQAILQLGGNIDAKDRHGHTALHLVAKRELNYVDDEFDGLCLELLLSNGASVAAKNNEGHNALSLALQRTMWWGRPSTRDNILSCVQQLVAKGSSVQDGFAMWRMVESFPSLVPAALNRSFCSNTSARDSPHLCLDFDFGPLLVNVQKIQEKSRPSLHASDSQLPPPLLHDSEVAMLHYILWAGRKRLLLHPLCHSFLHLKWCKVRKFFLANVVFYFLFVLSLTAFLLSSHNCATVEPRSNNTNPQPPAVASISAVPTCRWAGQEAGVVGLTWWCLVIFSALLDLREVIQLMQNPFIYLCNLGNIIDAMLVFCVPQLLIGSSADGEGGGEGLSQCCLGVWQQSVGAISLILAWVRFMLFTGQFPSCGVYIVMFSTVARNVLKFLAMYLCVLVAFALSFHILLRNLQTFATPSISLVTALVMMTGELDYEQTFLSQPSQLSVLSICLLVFFIVMVYIILSNLLVGLAVSDMYAIRQRSEVLRLTRHVELMLQVEKLFRSRLVPRGLQRCLIRNIGIITERTRPTVSIHPNLTRGVMDSLFLLLSRVLGARALLIKLFEKFVSGFLPPEHEPSLPHQLVSAVLDVALHEHELDKHARLLHLKAMQFGHTGHHKSGPQAQPPPSASLTRAGSLTRVASLTRVTPVTRPLRSSWRWTFVSDTDGEDEASDALHPLAHPPSSWLGQRALLSDNSARLDELHNLVLGLQASMQALTVTVQQQHNSRTGHSSTTNNR